uniref:Ig-like domain-containing protein n=1 Tax=Callorhinchus milii TaxID=7868 RepID=A0A4W3H575_CALMI
CPVLYKCNFVVVVVIVAVVIHHYRRAGVRNNKKNLIFSIIQTYNNTRVTTPNTTCNAPSKDFYLQIESVDVTDEGEYKCDIATRKGNFQKIFSLTVIVPPNISISCENNSNGTKTAVCTASNGKPKGNITWQPTNEENIISTVENSNSTVTVQSKYIITDTSNYKGHLTCIVTHPKISIGLSLGNTCVNPILSALVYNVHFTFVFLYTLYFTFTVKSTDYGEHKQKQQ